VRYDNVVFNDIEAPRQLAIALTHAEALDVDCVGDHPHTVDTEPVDALGHMMGGTDHKGNSLEPIQQGCCQLVGKAPLEQAQRRSPGNAQNAREPALCRDLRDTGSEDFAANENEVRPLFPDHAGKELSDMSTLCRTIVVRCITTFVKQLDERNWKARQLQAPGMLAPPWFYSERRFHSGRQDTNAMPALRAGVEDIEKRQGRATGVGRKRAYPDDVQSPSFLAREIHDGCPGVKM
jgi:hypothetical protein